MQYQVFVKNQSDKHFTASVIEMPSIAVDGNTEAEAIANAKTALKSQLAMGKIVTISLLEPPIVSIEANTSSIPTGQYAGILENDPTFDDWMEKLTNIRQSANQIEDEI
jgi:predicted RNase H-like HicB family nuclease